MVTGQQKIIHPEATHISSTVEMVQVGDRRSFEVGVLDEIQLISDINRGFAWTDVLLNSPTDHLIFCGNSGAKVSVVLFFCFVVDLMI